MDNPFVGLIQIPDVAAPGDPMVRKLSEESRKQKRDAMYAKYSPTVNNILDQLIAAYRPGVWKKGSDCDHEYCCHCRWYAGLEETGRAHYGDHPIRRRIEIELDVDHQCEPTGFKVLNYDNNGKCVHVGLSEDELVRGIKTVFEL
jgi:hypothetical protein